jgi:hypothetical protein
MIPATRGEFAAYIKSEIKKAGEGRQGVGREA